jgi:MFS family permease
MRGSANKPLILAALVLAAFAINLDTTIVNVALPTLVRELHASTTQLDWIVDAYNLLFAAFVLAAGTSAIAWAARASCSAGWWCSAPRALPGVWEAAPASSSLRAR